MHSKGVGLVTDVHQAKGAADLAIGFFGVGTAKF